MEPRVGEPRLRLDTERAEHEVARVGGAAGRLIQDARLADARLAGDAQRTARAADRGDQVADPLQLALAAEKLLGARCSAESGAVDAGPRSVQSFNSTPWPAAGA